MAATGPLAIGEEFFLYFTVSDLYGSPVTGAMTGDFTVTFVRNGQAVSPHGLVCQEIGAGLYHWTNQAGRGYVSPAREQSVILFQHTPSGTGLMRLDFFSLLRSRMESVDASVLLSSVNDVIDRVLAGQAYKVGDYYVKMADLNALMAMRTLLTEEIEAASPTSRSSLAALYPPV